MEKKDSRSVERMQMALTRRHPDHAAAIERLIEVCERFRELCRDYLECGEVLRRLEHSPNSARCRAHRNCVRERTDEYTELQEGLEQELLDCIEGRAIYPHCGTKHGRETVEH